MRGVIPGAVVLAVVWAVFTHPREVVYTLGGFAAGVAFTSSLPWFVRWGQDLARDSTGVGAHGIPYSRPLGAPKPLPPMPEPIRRGVRIPVHIERLRDEASDALRSAGVKDPYLPPKRSEAN